MKYKKMTRKEIEGELQKVDTAVRYLVQKLKEMEHYNYSLGKLVDSFIKFSKKEKEFMKFVKDLVEKEVKNAKKSDTKHAKLPKENGDNKKSK
tara:strand:+ start:2854 stop:3132 length:279 start_codon:yes stop_codon:yes gene_type:complete